MSIWKDVIAGVTGPVAQYFQRRAELKQAKFEAQLKFELAMGERRAQLILAGLAADANWEMEFAQQAATSWKDEYTLAVVSLPAVLCFVKVGDFDGAEVVSRGMAALSATPLWFQTILGIMFCATVGVRWWRRTQYDTGDAPATSGVQQPAKPS